MKKADRKNSCLLFVRMIMCVVHRTHGRSEPMEAGVLPPFTGLVLSELLFVQTNKKFRQYFVYYRNFFVRYGRKRTGQNR